MLPAPPRAPGRRRDGPPGAWAHRLGVNHVLAARLQPQVALQVSAVQVLLAVGHGCTVLCGNGREGCLGGFQQCSEIWAVVWSHCVQRQAL